MESDNNKNNTNFERIAKKRLWNRKTKQKRKAKTKDKEYSLKKCDMLAFEKTYENVCENSTENTNTHTHSQIHRLTLS